MSRQQTFRAVAKKLAAVPGSAIVLLLQAFDTIQASVATSQGSGLGQAATAAGR